MFRQDLIRLIVTRTHQSLLVYVTLRSRQIDEVLLHGSSNLKLGRRQFEEAGDALFLFEWLQLQLLLTDIERVI
jgi:hypothetical protein